jgi:hypothetical protein
MYQSGFETFEAFETFETFEAFEALGGCWPFVLLDML